MFVVNYPLEYVNVMAVLQMLVTGDAFSAQTLSQKCSFFLKKVWKEFEAISDDHPDVRLSSPDAAMK